MEERKGTAFDILFEYVSNPENKRKLKKDVFRLVFEKRTFETRFFTETWMDNGLEKDDPNYKEFQGMYFKNIENDKFIEISKDKVPLEIYVNENKIF